MTTGVGSTTPAIGAAVHVVSRRPSGSVSSSAENSMSVSPSVLCLVVRIGSIHRYGAAALPTSFDSSLDRNPRPRTATRAAALLHRADVVGHDEGGVAVRGRVQKLHHPHLT